MMRPDEHYRVRGVLVRCVCVGVFVSSGIDNDRIKGLGFGISVPPLQRYYNSNDCMNKCDVCLSHILTLHAT